MTTHERKKEGKKERRQLTPTRVVRFAAIMLANHRPPGFAAGKNKCTYRTAKLSLAGCGLEWVRLSHPQVDLCRASAAAGPSPGAVAVPDDDERGAAAAPLLPAQEHEQRPRVVPRERGLQRLRLAGGHNG